jgi:hypothetical protein
MNASPSPSSSLDDELSSLLSSMTAFRTSLTSPTVPPPLPAISIITEEASLRHSRILSQCVATTTSPHLLSALATDVCTGGVDDTVEHAVANAATAYLNLKADRLIAFEAIEDANVRGDVLDAALERVRCAIASFDIILADRDGEMASAAADRASVDRFYRYHTIANTLANRADTLQKVLSQQQ